MGPNPLPGSEFLRLGKLCGAVWKAEAFPGADVAKRFLRVLESPRSSQRAMHPPGRAQWCGAA